MSEAAKQFAKVDYYIKLVLKRRWFVIVPFCLSVMTGLVLSIILPKIYTANNLILVVPQSVPHQYVKRLSEKDIAEQIRTIEQQITTSTNIKKLMKALDLFSGPKYSYMYEEDKVKNIREMIRLKVTRTGGSSVDSFSIEFSGTNPERVKDTVNWISESFITESVKLMESQAIETNLFLDGELADLQGKLKTIEKTIKEYRQKHMGELPEELPSNLATLKRLQETLLSLNSSVRDARNRLVLIENQIAMANYAADSSVSLIKTESDVPPPEEGGGIKSQLDEQRAILEKLLTKYTEHHPDVVIIKERIAILEQESADKEPAGIPDGEPADSPMDHSDDTETSDKEPTGQEIEYAGEVSTASPFYFELKMQQDEIKNEISHYQQEINKTEEMISKYQLRVENTSRVEQELIDRNRNYTNLQRSYNNLLDKKLESDIAVNLEKKQKGQKFRVLDTAQTPKRPVSPNIKIIFLACLAAGIGLGLGAIFLMDTIDNTFKVPEDIESSLQVPLLATIPDINSKTDVFRHRCNQFFSVVAACIALGMTGLFALFAIRGVDRTLSYFNKILSLLPI